MIRWVAGAALGAAVGCGAPDMDEIRTSDVAAARDVFLENVAAIEAQDAERYLALYLESPNLVTVSPDGIVRGFEPLAASRRASGDWPDSLVAGEPVLAWLAPGVVYGVYEYSASQGGQRSSGWSERILVKTGEGWRIAATTVIPAGQ